MTEKKLLRFIHVGKCGGSTIEKLLVDSTLVSQKYDSVVHDHVCGVSLDTNCDYLICLRNPIERAMSAYEWRMKLVVLDPPPNQANRFRGERDVLKVYKSFSDLASKLYQNNGSLITAEIPIAFSKSEMPLDGFRLVDGKHVMRA